MIAKNCKLIAQEAVMVHDFQRCEISCNAVRCSRIHYGMEPILAQVQHLMEATDPGVTVSGSLPIHLVQPTATPQNNSLDATIYLLKARLRSAETDAQTLERRLTHLDQSELSPRSLGALWMAHRMFRENIDTLREALYKLDSSASSSMSAPELSQASH